MIKYFDIHWQLLYIVLLIICWLCIDKLTTAEKYNYILAIGLGIPTYFFLVATLGPAPSYTPGLRELYYGGLNYILFSLLPGSIIGAIISIIKYIHEYIFYERKYRKKK